MRAGFYNVVRDLHLYLGLFISPFVLVFSVSVFFLVHAWIPKFGSDKSSTRVVADLALPNDLQNLSGRKLIDALKAALEQQNIHGELSFVRHDVKENKLIVPLIIPGRETTITINTTNHQATVVTRETGLADALITLHKFPGQHLPDIRMNWIWMKFWLWMADATVYLILFISISGIYLWYILRAERKIGFALLAAGAISFFGMIYGLIR